MSISHASSEFNRFTLIFFLLLAVAGPGPSHASPDGPLTVLDIQPYRLDMSASILDSQGRRGLATLMNLNPNINAWYILTLEWEGQPAVTYHLENAWPGGQRLRVDSAHPEAILIDGEDGTQLFGIWEDLPRAAAERVPTVALCEGRIELRNPTTGRKTNREWATDFLRNCVPAGEKITSFVRSTFYKDAFLSVSDVVTRQGPAADGDLNRFPGPARVNPLYGDQYLSPTDLGLPLDTGSDGRLRVGAWYRLTGLPGVFASAIEPRLVADDLISAQQGMVNPLDEVESDALAFLVAFDLERYELGFAMGTEHPRVDWSDVSLPEVRDPALPGPDGFDSLKPIVNTGIVSPSRAGRTVATFTGGFKRFHGAFKRGDLALQNHGSHYGFVEQGVILSRLQPGLATASVDARGRMELKTWTVGDSAGLADIRHARQNGVPILEFDARTGAGIPGPMVKRSSLGNWSGSVDGRYRTLRASLALQEHGGRRFLIYGYFSTATPSAMARVLQAYGCRYAMMTDMNALEHTYLAVYGGGDVSSGVHHLVKGMEVLDRTSENRVIPRFIGYADNRDFFYVMRRTP